MLGGNRNLEGFPGFKFLVGFAVDLQYDLALQHVGRLKTRMKVRAGARSCCDCRDAGNGRVSRWDLRSLHDLARDALRRGDGADF